MTKLRLILFLMGTGVASSAFSQSITGMSPTDILSEINQDASECAGYLEFTASCTDNSNRSDLSLRLRQARAKAEALAAKSGVGAGMLPEAIKARMELAGKNILDTTRGQCINISILFTRFIPKCQNLLDNPMERVKELQVLGEQAAWN